MILSLKPAISSRAEKGNSYQFNRWPMRILRFILFLVLASPCVFSQQFSIEDWQIWDFKNNGNHFLWCSVKVKDGRVPLKGLSPENFVFTERLLSPQKRTVSSRSITFDQPAYQFNGPGFWERSVSSEKVDFVFLIDKTGSMGETMESVKAELKDFVKRLQTASCDYRIALYLFEHASLEVCGNKSPDFPFFGVMESTEVLEAIDRINTAGEWHTNTWGYDAILYASQLRFREKSHKKLIVITDTFPQTVHGPFWYFSGGSIATRSAVDLAIKEKNLELFYCQPPIEAAKHLEANYSPSINPEVAAANFDRLLAATALSWPFDEGELPVGSGGVVESVYYFAWVSELEGIAECVQEPGYTVEVEIGLSGQNKKFSYSPFFDRTGHKIRPQSHSIRVMDEQGNALGDRIIELDLLRLMGDRTAFNDANWQFVPRNGMIKFDAIDPGPYLYRLYDNGRHTYAYSALRLGAEGRLIFDRESVLPASIVVPTADTYLETVKARGLLQELRDSRIATIKLRKLVDAGEDWLASIAQGGFSLQEMEALKRFNVALGAFVNASSYATVETDRIENDMAEMVKDAREIVAHAREIADKISSLKSEILSAVSLAIDIITGNWSGVSQQISVQALIDKFVAYVKNDLLDDILEAARNKLREYLSDPEKLTKLISLAKGDIKGWIMGEDSEADYRASIKDLVVNDLNNRYFLSPLTEELEEALSLAKAISVDVGEPSVLDESSRVMENDFSAMRSQIMGPLQEWSFRVLGDHERIDNWESTLEIFEETVPLLVELLRLLEYKNPTFGEVADQLAKLSNVMDAVGLITLAYEVGLKADQLTTMSNKLRQINPILFPREP